MSQDQLGNAVSAADEATLRGIDDYVAGFLGYEKRAVNILEAADADADATLANVYAGFTWMFLEAAGAKDAASGYLKRAQASVTGANERERMLLALLERWIVDDVPGAQSIGEEIVDLFPRDLVTVKLHQYMSFNRGDVHAMLRIARKAEPYIAENAHLHGMLAFGLEQTDQISEAEIAARKALSIKHKEPWAQHALAHVMLSTGRVREGEAFMADASRTWVDLNSFMYTHNWWHRAVFNISLGDFQAVFDAYDNHVWGIEKDYSQDQVGAVSLLARMEVAGLDVGDRWGDVADHLKVRAGDTVQPFLSLQYLYGLARADREEADDLMAAIADKAASTTAFDRIVWREVALPAARGVLAHARRDFRVAADNLALALPRMIEIGGSHAQRDLFGQLLQDAYLKSENWVAARQMLEKRRLWDPDGVPVKQGLALVAARLGGKA